MSPVLDAVEPPAAPPTDVTSRAVAATLACVARHGVAKLTVDDIAREAGCSRATLYRSFPSKRALLEAAVASEGAAIAARLVAVAESAPTFADAVTDVVVDGARALREHAALAFVAAHEPALLHPHLSVAGGDRFLGLAAEQLTSAFARFADDPRRAAEWTTRLGLCLVWFPDPPVDVTDRAAVHAYVSAFVTPGLAPRASVLATPQEG